ncbi:MAG TPA: helix-turn-helix transcriptional regulator [Candidatus Paceibacterota bacterium]
MNAELAAGLGRIIEYIRVIEVLTQADLAKILGTKQSGISRLERGKGLPTLGLIVKAANIFGFRIHIKFISEKRHVVLDSEGMFRADEHAYNWSLWPPDKSP